MTLTNKLLVDICKTAIPNAENDLVAVDIFSQRIYKLTVKTDGQYFYEISELYLKLIEIKKILREQRAKLYTVYTN